jgi:tetratricopeptide (TPR) repeat protein
MYLSGSKWNTRKRKPRRSNPWRVAALLLLIAGVIYLERNVLPQTEPLFVATVEPTRSPASFILEAETLFEAGHLQQAIEAYEEAIAVDPQGSDFYAALARVQVYAGDYQGAVTNAQNAVLLESNSAYANAVLGWALDFLAQQDPEAATISDALTLLEDAVRLNPDSAMVRAFYAEVIIDDNVANFESARQQAELAVQLDPNLLEAQRALGYVWERTGNYDLAFEAYSSALRINDKLALLHIAIGNMHFNLGDANSALNSYIRASTLAPEDVIPLRLIVQAYARVGEFGKASQYAQSAVELEPASARLHGDLGRMFYKNGDYQSAIASLALAIHGGAYEDGISIEGLPLDPGDALVVDIYSMYGLALAKQSQCGLAVDLAEALVTGVPDNELAAGNAQEILIECGQLEPPPETEA